MLIIGVDPGGSHTGIVARDGAALIDWVVAHRDEKPGRGLSDPTYMRSVLDAIDRMATGPFRVAVEDVHAPTGFKGGERAPISPGPLIQAGIVLGGVLAAYQDVCVVIPPGGNGSGMLGSYPDQLVSPAERARGLRRPAGQSSQLRHARSAWDVAGTGGRRIARCGDSARFDTHW